MRWNRMITSVCIFLLGLTRILIAVFAIGVLVLTVIEDNWVNSITFSTDEYQFDDAVNFKTKASYKEQSYDNITIKPKAYTVSIADVPISKYWMSAPSILIAPILYYFLGLILKLLKSIEEREFFSLANVKRLRIIGFMILGTSIIQWLYSILIDYFLRSEFRIEGFSKLYSRFWLNFDFISSLWFLGLMILLVANAFEHGLRLKEEQELTI